jgi:malonyl-CoA O-methyltransferase
MPTPAVPQRAFDPQAARHLSHRLLGRAEPPWLHQEAARRMAERLPVIRLQPKTVIDWWGWLGASDAVLTAAYPKARRRIVEPDAAWRERSQAALTAPWWSLQRFRGGATVELADELPAAAGELLWANMMLQAVADPPAVMAQWHRALAVDGFLMFSALGPGTLIELRQLYGELGWPSPMAPLVDMHDLGDMLVHAGFADPVMDQETVQLSWPSAEALLAELRSLGGNVDPQRAPGLRTPRWHRCLLQALQRRADGQGRISLSFELVYGHAFRPPPRPKLQPSTEVSLDEMRAMVRAGRSNGS